MTDQEKIKLIHESLEEEKEIDYDMAVRIQNFIEYENRKWMLEHRDDKVVHNGTDFSMMEIIIANKMGDYTDLDLDDDEVFRQVDKGLRAYYGHLTEENLLDKANCFDIDVGDEKVKVNCCENLESHIIKYDPNYAEYLDERVDWFYESYKDYERRKEAGEIPEDEPVDDIDVSNSVAPVERDEDDDFEDGDFEEESYEDDEEFEDEEEVRTITTVEEWVEELGNYVVRDNKLVRRK